MAQLTERIGRAVSRHMDSAFVDALSPRDGTSLSTLIEEFFCSGTDEDDQGTRAQSHNIACPKHELKILLYMLELDYEETLDDVREVDVNDSEELAEEESKALQLKPVLYLFTLHAA